MLAELPVHRPATLDDALLLLAEPPDGRTLTPMAGGTDLMVLLQARAFVPQAVLDLWRLDELRAVEEVDEGLHVGALSTYRDLIGSPAARALAPMLVEAARTVGATQIQARGTLAGNVANASPAGDTLPVLLAQGATIELASRARGSRRVRADDFFLGYRQIDRAPDELIVGITFDRMPEGATWTFRKVGTRMAQSISKVMLAGIGALDGDRIGTLRLAAGSVAPVPVRLGDAERVALGGRPAEVAAAAGRAARDAVTPIDDVRSNAGYRREVTGRLVERFVGSLAGA